MEKRKGFQKCRLTRQVIVTMIATLVLMLGSMGMFVSCSKKDSVPVVKLSKDDPVEINFWYAFTGKIQECNVNLANQFNETVGKEMGVKVIAEYQGDYAAVHQKLQASWVAGNPPDVSVIEIASMGGFAQNGVLHALDPFVKRDNVNMDDFQKGLMGNSYYENNVYGVPYLRSTPILYLNTTILEKAGLDPAGPKTWDEFEYFCRQIKEKTGLFGATMSSYIWTFEGFMIQAGTTVLSADEQTCLIDGKEARDFVKFIQRLNQEGLIRIYTGADGSKSTSDVMSQNAAMWFASTANMTTNLGIAAENKFGLNTCFMPKLVQYGCPTGGCNVAITSKGDARKVEAAWQFVKWLTDTNQTAYASSFTGYMPSRHSAISSALIQDLYKVKPQFKVAVDQLAYASSRPMNPAYQEVSKLIIESLDAVWANNQNVDTVFPETVRQANIILKE